MRKLLIIANEQEKHGAAPSPHKLKIAHETQLREAARGTEMEIVIATPSEAIAHYDSAEVVAAFPMRMPSIEKLPAAKWLHSFSAGVDKILTPAVAQSPVRLTSSSGIHATPIAESILASMLLFARGFVKTFYAQTRHAWKKDEMLGELRDAHLLVVGLGAIGRETARLAHEFGAKISAVSRSGNNKPDFVERLEKSEKLDGLLAGADYVVITLPGTEETKHLFNKEKFSRMKQNAVLINIGRGSIINEADLINALQKGDVAGAALDVFEQEPLPAESPLWNMHNVVITPHHSGLSHRYMDRAIETLIVNIRAYLAGEKLPNEVNKRIGY